MSSLRASTFISLLIRSHDILMNERPTMCLLESLNVLKVERSEAGNAFLKGREVLSSYHEDGTRQTLDVCGQDIVSVTVFSRPTVPTVPSSEPDTVQQPSSVICGKADTKSADSVVLTVCGAGREGRRNGGRSGRGLCHLSPNLPSTR